MTTFLFITLPFANFDASLALKTKIEALHLQFMEGAQFSYLMILHRQSFPGISWEAKKTIYLLSHCYHHDNMRGNKYKIEL